MRRADRIRRMIAQEAARLMYVEGVKEYRDAKRKAAKAFGPEKALSLGSHLPSNAEVHRELQRLIGLYEEKIQPERLLRLRILALQQMELLAPFRPYLVGSVLSGAVTGQSDIDLHLFAPHPDEVEEFLREREIPFETETVCIRHGGEFFDYTHVYLEDDGVVVECTVYPLADIHRIPRSSITGRPMERVNANGLRRIIAAMGGEEEGG